MLKHILIGLLASVVGYVLVAVITYFLIMRFSSNTHDRQMEAATTSVIILGPLAGILAFVVGYLWSKNSF